MAKRIPQPICSLAELLRVVKTGRVNLDDWVVAVDSGCCYFRYIGDSEDEPDCPLKLCLPTNYRLLIDALRTLGIPAEGA